MADSSTCTVHTPEDSPAETDHEHESDKISAAKSSSLLSSKKADFPSPSRKLGREKVFVDDNAEKSTVSPRTPALPVVASVTKTADTVLPQRSSSTKSTNVFSARDLGVVSPVKEIVRNDKDKVVRKSY